MSSLIQADSDQLKMALIQTEASLKSMDQGGIQAAAAHAKAASSHIEIASRDATGKTLKDLAGCKTLLRKTQQESEKNQISEARAAAEKVRNSLRKLTGY